MGVICLQGGREHTAACVGLDSDLLELAEGGPVVVLALASENLRSNAAAADLAKRHFLDLGASAVSVITDPGPAAAAVEAVRGARLVVIPGGSPRVLIDAMHRSGLATEVTRAAADGTVISGASAGAMVLCEWMVLPGRRLEVGPGLGLVEGLVVLPHYDGGHADWVSVVRARLGDDVDMIGLPECSGVLLDGEAIVAVGAAAATLLTVDGPRLLAI
ncbi:MAG TPA: Type 1 glutamine amidotransferase-like domain-containing protein [Mycobacteriales bacterium]|nr:Type 1 glutamine amidotransferase-like domain-containing protein [Mycobacteriales bacterium]